jgi:GntR family transcriptional regulator
MEPEILLAQLRNDVEGASASTPLHKRLKAALEGAILNNSLKPGAGLPGERVISEALALSRVTVRKSIEALVEEGLLHRRHGAKTEVGSRVEKSLSTLTSFSEDMSARGLEPGCRWISKKISRPSPAEMMALAISADSYVIRMKRIRTADGIPMAVETSTVPTRFLSSPEMVGDSLYQALEKLGAMPQRAIQRMRSRPASVSDAGYLNCEPGAPLLIMERRCFLADEQIVEFSETRYKGDVYDFVFELNR